MIQSTLVRGPMSIAAQTQPIDLAEFRVLLARHARVFLRARRQFRAQVRQMQSMGIKCPYSQGSLTFLNLAIISVFGMGVWAKRVSQ